MILRSRLIWYLQNSAKLFVVSVRLLIHSIFHPKLFFRLGFSLFSTLNEFYQYTHGKLYPFKETQTYKKLKNEFSFAKCNYYYSDKNVARSLEVLILSTLVQYFKPKTIFEIGTYTGFTTLHFAQNSKEDTVIYTLDLPPNYGQEKLTHDKLEKYSYDDHLVVELSTRGIDNRVFHKNPLRKKIIEIYGDSMRHDFNPYKGKMDFIFIDGCHAYDYIKSDTENAFKMLSENGVIVWHDYDYIIHRDVFKYLNSLVKDYRIYSIPNTRFAIYGKNI